MTNSKSIYSNYYKNILDDLGDALNNELLLEELVDFIQPEQVVAFIEHLRVVADIEDFIPADYPTSEQSEEAKAYAYAS